MRKEPLTAHADVFRDQAVSQPSELTRIQLGADNAHTPYIEHWVVQLHGVQPGRIDDPEVLTHSLSALVAELGLTQVSLSTQVTMSTWA